MIRAAKDLTVGDVVENDFSDLADHAETRLTVRGTDNYGAVVHLCFKGTLLNRPDLCVDVNSDRPVTVVNSPLPDLENVNEIDTWLNKPTN